MLSARFTTLDRFGVETGLKIEISPTYTNGQIQALADALDAILLGSAVRAEVEEVTIIDPGSILPATDDEADEALTWSFIVYGPSGIEQPMIGTADWSLLEPDRFDLDLTTGLGLAFKNALLAVFRFPDGTAATGILDDRARAVNLNPETFLDREVLPVRPVISATMYKNSTAQTLANNTVTVVTFDQVDLDQDGLGNLTNDQFVIPRTGRYTIIGRVFWAPSTAGQRRLILLMDSIAIYNVTQLPPLSGSMGQEISLSIHLFEGTTIKLQATQSSGGNLDIGLAGTAHYFTALSIVGF